MICMFLLLSGSLRALDIDNTGSLFFKMGITGEISAY